MNQIWHLRSHLKAIMALDHSRLDLENKSGRTFCVRQVYFTKSCQQIWGACKPTLYTFYTLPLRWNSTMKRAFLVFFFSIQNSEKMQYFTINCAIQIVLIQYSGRSQYAWDFSETVKKKFPKSPIRPAGSHSWQAPNLQCELLVFEWTLIELRFNIYTSY